MTNPHRIEVTDAEAWTGTMVCDAPVGAPCRMHCEICEEYLEDDHDTHNLRDQGYCLKVEGWFDDSIEGCYDGPDRGWRREIESGPVLITWNGDWMVWAYDEAVPGSNEPCVRSGAP